MSTRSTTTVLASVLEVLDDDAGVGGGGGRNPQSVHCPLEL